MLRKPSLEEWPPILLAGAGIAGLLPMAIYRFTEGNVLVGTIDFVAAVAFAVIAWTVVAKGAVRTASILMAAVAIGTAVTTVSIRGGYQIMWMFPATVALFYLLQPREAAITATIASIIVSPRVIELAEVGHKVVFVGSLLVTVLLSIAFAFLVLERTRALEATNLVDPLTGIGNRRALDEALENEIKKTQRSGITFVLMMIDVDFFKSVNDRYGHSTGDIVLKGIASCLASEIRPTDSCFRAGGEEFVVIAHGVRLSDAQLIAERLRAAISEILHQPECQSEPITVTASFGLAEFRPPETRDRLYGRADKALYIAKDNGRNQLHFFEGTASLSGTDAYEIESSPLDLEVSNRG